MQTTLNNVTEALAAFAESHLMINDFMCGQTWDFQSRPNTYPAMLAVTYPAVIGQGSVRVSFQVFLTDRANSARDNINEMHSDLLQVAGDLFAYLRDNDEALGFSLATESLVCEPFTEQFDDVLAGWTLALEVEYRFSGSSCGLPIK